MQFLARAREHGVLMGHIGEGRIRAVTHYGLDADHIRASLVGIRRALLDL
jgi:threonine aldolase